MAGSLEPAEEEMRMLELELETVVALEVLEARAASCGGNEAI